MFSGVGEFFKPMSVSRATEPSAAPSPSRPVGDERPPFWPQDRAVPRRRRRGDGFGDDVIRISLGALRLLLSGKVARAEDAKISGDEDADDDAAPAVAPDAALAAYRRAEDTASFCPVPKAGSPVITAPASVTGENILALLDALEKKGLRTLHVNDGETIYAALLRHARPVD